MKFDLPLFLLSLVLGVVMTFAFSIQTVNADQITIDTDQLDATTLTQVLQAKKKASETKVTVDNVKEYVTIGKEIGMAIAATCKELSVEVNQFVKTPVGKITMALIVYKVVGEKLWDIVGGTLAWIIITIIIWRSFRHFHMNERVVDKSDKQKPLIEYVPRYVFNDRDYRPWSVFVHVVAFVAITITCLAIVF